MLQSKILYAFFFIPFCPPLNAELFPVGHKANPFVRLFDYRKLKDDTEITAIITQFFGVGLSLKLICAVCRVWSFSTYRIFFLCKC